MTLFPHARAGLRPMCARAARILVHLIGSSSLLISFASSAAAQSDSLIARGSQWRYLDGGNAPGNGWHGLAFNDGTWAQGAAKLGFGEGDENTQIALGNGSSGATTYFRHEFSVANTSVYQALTLRVQRDDGVIAYLNGIELMRSNMPSGNVAHATAALSEVAWPGEGLFYSTTALAEALVSGTNVLAVELHQISGSTLDASFDGELIAHRQPIVSRGPYLQKGSDSAMTLRWRTFPASTSRVWYGSSPTNLSSVVSDSALRTDHEIELTGLTPATTYHYAVGSNNGIVAGADSEHHFTTNPVPGLPHPTRVWILGDSGAGSSGARQVRDAYRNFTGATPTSFWLMLGDNAYASGSDDEFGTSLFEQYPLMLKQSALWSTRGNHEINASVYYDIFNLPRAGEVGGLPSGTEAYYSFDHANVHFLCLDSMGSNLSVGNAMWSWADADLAATTQDWIVAFWHHPPYSRGSHNSDTENRMIRMRENFLPLLEGHGVDLVLSGHSHSYERSYLIDGHYGDSSSLTSAMVLDSGSGQIENDGAYNKRSGAHQGTIYTVAGSSGKTGGSSLDHPVMFRSIPSLGSVVLDVDGGRLDVRFLRDTGEVADHWTLLGETYTGNYCAAPATSQGCVAKMEATGTPSVSNNSLYTLSVTAVPRNKLGLLFYGTGPSNQPFFGGRLCVSAPVVRTSVQTSGGNAGPCSGSFSFDFNHRIQAGNDPNLVAGHTVYAQYWFRDQGGGAALSDGYQFVLQP